MRTWLEMIDDLERLTNELKDKWAEEMKARGLVPSRPKGKWFNPNPPGRSDGIMCDQCGYDSIARYNYCPSCGVEMERE